MVVAVVASPRTRFGIELLLVLVLPLAPLFLILPIVGAGLNGTSSVLYGTLAEFVDARRRARGFGFFYTMGIGAGSLSPLVLGAVGDVFGVAPTLAGLAAFVALTLPLAALLRAPLAATA